MTTHEVTTRSDLTPAIITPVGVSGDPDPTDYVTPYLTLVQGTSASGTPGQFIFTSGEEKKIIEFVVVHIALTRTYYDRDLKEIICSSNDRRTGNARKLEVIDPDAGVVGRMTLTCSTCPRYHDSPWDKLCVKDYALTCIDLETNEAFLFRVKGAATGTFRNKIINPALKGRAPWQFSWSMKSERQSKDGNNWYEPRLSQLEMYSDEQQAEWAAFAGQFTRHEDDPAGIDPDDLPFE